MKKLLMCALTVLLTLSVMLTTYAGRVYDCPVCGGSGGQIVEDGYMDADGDWVDVSYYEYCLSCQGTGNCSTCGGLGTW